MDLRVSQDEQIVYGHLPDEEIVQRAQSGDKPAEEYILNKYHRLVSLWTRSYFLQGGDSEDLEQEGMIGLYKAIRDFSHGSSSFWSFAKLCITRNVISAVKCTTRQKHVPLNSYTSLHKSVCDYEGERSLIDMLSDQKVEDPESLAISKEHWRNARRLLKAKLSDFEYEVFQLYALGYAYKEIAATLDTHIKSVDNALCRIKTKMETIV